MKTQVVVAASLLASGMENSGALLNDSLQNYYRLIYCEELPTVKKEDTADLAMKAAKWEFEHGLRDSPSFHISELDILAARARETGDKSAAQRERERLANRYKELFPQGGTSG